MINRAVSNRSVSAIAMTCFNLPSMSVAEEAVCASATLIGKNTKSAERISGIHRRYRKFIAHMRASLARTRLTAHQVQARIAVDITVGTVGY